MRILLAISLLCLSLVCQAQVATSTKFGVVKTGAGIGNTAGTISLAPTVTTVTNGKLIDYGTHKVLLLQIAPTVAMGQTVDLSAAGFTSAPFVQVIAERNTTDPMQVPNVALQTKSSTTLKVNITQPNNATVTILGTNVLSGGPSVAASPLTNIILNITATGN